MVAQDQGGTHPPLGHGGLPTPALVGAVQDVVVEEGGLVDHLDRQGSHPEALGEAGPMGGGHKRPGDPGPEELAGQRRYGEPVGLEKGGRPAEAVQDRIHSFRGGGHRGPASVRHRGHGLGHRAPAMAGRTSRDPVRWATTRVRE